MEKGIWLDYPENMPQDNERVIAHIKGDGNYWVVLVYNEYCECWDNEDGDDYFCELDNVDKFMIVPDV